MYEDHFGLIDKPFRIAPDSDTGYLGHHQEQALAYVEYSIREKVGYILLTGEMGVGKTTLLHCLLKRLDPSIDVAAIFNTHASQPPLFQRILDNFGLSAERADKRGYPEQLYPFLVDRQAEGRCVLLIVDDAQNLADEALEEIQTLSNLQTDHHPLISIVLVGQPEITARLQRPEFHPIAQRFTLSYHLPSLNEEETKRYIAYRIQKVGGEPGIFTPEAIRKMYHHSGGNPRTINMIGKLALLLGYTNRQKVIDDDAIGKVMEKTVILAPTEAPPYVLPTSPSASGSRLETLLMERIRHLEAELADAKHRYERWEQAEKKRLVTNYQDLLARERERYDHLMEKYSQLLSSHGEKPSVEPAEDKDAVHSQRNVSPLEKSAKFTRLLRMVETAKTPKKDGRENRG